MKKLSLIMPYYDNPGMLAIHYATWAAYPDHLKERLEVVIVDDGSPNVAAAEVPRPEGLPALKIFRVTIDKKWHQHAARNIGAHEAKGPWLLLTDMDHLLPVTSFVKLLKIEDENVICTLARLDAPDMLPKLHPVSGKPHPHPNSFVMTREKYWEIGGYDEDFCGIYGTDGYFRARLPGAGELIHLKRTPLVRYPREIQPDASTTSLQRKEGRVPGEKKDIIERKKRDGTFGKAKVLSMPYVRAFP